METDNQVPAMNRCQDRRCRCFGQPLVDRGYGYPVCPSTPWNPEDPNRPADV